MIRRAVYLVMGSTSCLLGASIILWAPYNLLIHRLPEYRLVQFIGIFGVGPVFCTVGAQWIRKSLC